MVPGATNLEDYGLNQRMHRLKENKKQNSVNIFILITCSCTKRPELKTFNWPTVNWKPSLGAMADICISRTAQGKGAGGYKSAADQRECIKKQYRIARTVIIETTDTE